MTAQQVAWITLAYAVELAGVIYFTRAGPRRVGGAIAGGLAGGLFFIGMVALGETLGWWHWQYPVPFTVGFAVLGYGGTVVSLVPLYLISWRVARRFGWSGLALAVAFVAVVGPPRDFVMAAYLPEWGRFSPGAVPVIADAATYAACLVVGHGVMRRLAGPAKDDRLARQPPG